MNQLEQDDPLDERLKEAWRTTDAPTLDDDWQRGVLDAVRATDSLSERESLWPVVRNAFLAAAAAASITAVFVLPGATSPTTEFARLITEDPQALLELVLLF